MRNVNKCYAITVVADKTLRRLADCLADVMKLVKLHSDKLHAAYITASKQSRNYYQS